MNNSTQPVPRRLRLGLVGCGRFGQFSLSTFATIPNLNLLGVSDRDQGRSVATGTAYGVAAYSGS